MFAIINPSCCARLCSDQRLHGMRREYTQARAAPGYEELDAARRRILEYDPNRVSVRAFFGGCCSWFKLDTSLKDGEMKSVCQCVLLSKALLRDHCVFPCVVLRLISASC